MQNKFYQVETIFMQNYSTLNTGMKVEKIFLTCTPCSLFRHPNGGIHLQVDMASLDSQKKIENERKPRVETYHVLSFYWYQFSCTLQGNPAREGQICRHERVYSKFANISTEIN